MATSYFRITRPSPNEPTSLTVSFDASRGTALMYNASSTAAASLASGKFVGFCSRTVTSGGAAMEDFILPGQLETEAQYGQAVTLEDALEVDVEGSDFLTTTSGTGYIHTALSAGTQLSFSGGKFYVKQTGDNAYFELISAGLTVQDSDNGVRILARRV